MPTDLVSLASQSPAVVLLVLGLYLFKVLVNDIKHDAEAARKSAEILVENAKKQTDLLERIDRSLAGRQVNTTTVVTPVQER